MRAEVRGVVAGARALAARRIAVVALLLPFARGMTQSASTLPITVGERLVYTAHAGPGLNARAEMWVDAGTGINGARLVVLNSEVKGGFGPFKVLNRSTSWLDPERGAIVRFTKEEKSPLGRSSEEVEFDADGRSWRMADGRTGVSPSHQPLDELSFIYVLRSLNLADNTEMVLNRHFDPERNPTIIKSLGAGSVTIDGRTWATREIEMRVHDARRYQGEGVIRISLSDDDCRRPVRIESRVPRAGNIIMELRSATPEIAACP